MLRCPQQQDINECNALSIELGLYNNCGLTRCSSATCPHTEDATRHRFCVESKLQKVLLELTLSVTSLAGQQQNAVDQSLEMRFKILLLSACMVF